MALTILEMAANVRQKKAELDIECQRLRDLKGDWTDHALAGEEAMKIAEDGLRNAWTILSRLERFAHVAANAAAKMTEQA